jgi:hypothetical protein
MRGLSFYVILFFPVFLFAQNRFNTLTVHTGQTYAFGASDILVTDTLIMEDSSRIQLNSLKTQNFIRVKVAIFGIHTVIDGNGPQGKKGKTGTRGSTATGPCRGGSSAANGTHGGDGAAGINLFLYIEKIIVNGNLVIDLSGGNGADGGDGGEGGGGSPGTVHCYGGNGGSGGNGGNGGNGGKGGILTFGGESAEDIRAMVGTKVRVNTLGGNLGYGGVHGAGGMAGLGPSKMHGKAGTKGKDGAKGKPGKNGFIQFEQQ